MISSSSSKRELDSGASGPDTEPNAGPRSGGGPIDPKLWDIILEALQPSYTNTGLRCSPSGHFVIVRNHETPADDNTPPGIYAMVYGLDEGAQGDHDKSFTRKPVNIKLLHRIRLADSRERDVEEWEAYITNNGNRVLAWSPTRHLLRLFDLEGNIRAESNLDSFQYEHPQVADWVARFKTRGDGRTYWFQLESDRLRQGIFELWRNSKPSAMCVTGARWLMIDNAKDSSVIYEIWDLDVADLTHDNSSRRKEACYNLGVRKLRDSVPHLVRRLRDAEADVCEAAAKALGGIGDPSALPGIVHRLGENISAGLENALDSALHTFTLRDVEPVISDCLARPAVAYRLGALRALDCLPALEATDRLIAALNDFSPAVRRKAAEIIQQRPAVKASAALLARLDDEDKMVREIVQQAAIACLRHGGLLSEDHAAALAVPIDLARFVDRVLNEGRVAYFSQMPSDTPASLLIGLTTACLRDQEALPQVMNALDDLTSASSYRSSEAATSIALVVALIAADTFRGNARHKEAARLYRRAAGLAAQVDAPQLEWRAWKAVGEICDAMDHASAAFDAFDAYRKAMSVIDALWFALLEEDKLRGFFQDKACLYERAALNCLRLGYHALALECNEKAKTRYLGDLIARRQKDPNTVLARELQDFWRKTDHLRPIRVPVAEGGGVTVQRVEIVAVEPAAAAAGDVPSVAPERWLALLRRYSEDAALHSRPGFLSMIREAWNVIARAAQLDDDDIRNGLEAFYQTLVPVYDAVRNELLPVEEPVRSQYAEDYDRAARELEALSDRNEPRIPFLTFREFEPSWIGALCASGEPGFRGDVLAALMEALNAYLHHEPVISVPVELDGSELPAVSFVTRSIRPESESFSQRTAVILSDLERLQTGKWRYVMQLARGEICAYRDIVAALKGKPDTALVQFMVTDEGTFVFVVIGQDAGQHETTGVHVSIPTNMSVLSLDWPTSSDLETLMANGESAWMGQYRQRNASTMAREAWLATMDSTIQELSEKLALPLVQHLKRHQIQRVWLVPHRGLHLVPFAALYTDAQKNRRLIDDFDICYAPSSTLQKICRERSQGRKWQRNLAIITNPTGDLPLSAMEGEIIQSYLRSADIAQWLGAEAERDKIAGVLAKSMFHFAGHGSYEWADPLASGLKLANKQTLSLGDLFHEYLQLPIVNLVALSACETNIADPTDLVDECLGIASGFVFAGAPAVMSTLWAVNALSTPMLVSRFYELLLHDHLSPSQALRQAQLWWRTQVTKEIIMEFVHKAKAPLQTDLNKAPKYGGKADRLSSVLKKLDDATTSLTMSNFTHPYYWAGLILTGIDTDTYPI